MMNCRNCGASLGESGVACVACGGATDERLFLGVVGFALLAAVALHVSVSRLGLSTRPVVSEVLASAGVGAGTLYLLVKLVQKALAPRRRVFDEMVAVFGDRFGRSLLGLLVLGFLWKGVPALFLRLQGVTLRGAGNEPVWFVAFRNIRGEAGLLLGLLALVALVRQGKAFFNPRVTNTMAAR